MIVIEIYKEYMVPVNLQEHMLRVASLAEIILGNWKGEGFDEESIVRACIFHDIAKPMSFDLAKQAQYGMSEEGIVKLERLQNRIETEFGQDEHEATVKICKEIGLSDKSVKLVDNLEWKFIPRLLENREIESLIPIYCDMRIGPTGILPLAQRLGELKERTNADDYEENVKNGNALEKLIKENVDLDLNSITDDQLQFRFKNFLAIQV